MTMFWKPFPSCSLQTGVVPPPAAAPVSGFPPLRTNNPRPAVSLLRVNPKRYTTEMRADEKRKMTWLGRERECFAGSFLGNMQEI